MNSTTSVIGLMNDTILNNIELAGDSFHLGGASERADVRVHSVDPLEMEPFGILRRRPQIEKGELYALLNSVPDTPEAGVSVMAVLRTDEGETYGSYLGVDTLNNLARQMKYLSLQPTGVSISWPQFVEDTRGQIVLAP